PYLISRSGCAGMQRYVQTWSGDNRTNWDTLRYNIRMAASARRAAWRRTCWQKRPTW
ncbi:hypothetical protein FK514_29525, partial [Klebsiella pneumoniae]|nr:hypothetical protein [Klebsiella pneumoniae]